MGVHEAGAKHLPHFKLAHVKRQLVGLPCGSHPLNVHRMRFHGVPRGQGHVKCVAKRGRWRIFILHFMLHSEHYAPIRTKKNIFSDSHAAGKDKNKVLHYGVES